MKYAQVSRTAQGEWLVWVEKSYVSFSQADATHSYLGRLGARKVFAEGDVDGLEGTYLLPSAVEVKLAIQ